MSDMSHMPNAPEEPQELGSHHNTQDRHSVSPRTPFPITQTEKWRQSPCCGHSAPQHPLFHNIFNYNNPIYHTYEIENPHTTCNCPQDRPDMLNDTPCILLCGNLLNVTSTTIHSSHSLNTQVTQTTPMTTQIPTQMTQPS